MPAFNPSHNSLGALAADPTYQPDIRPLGTAWSWWEDNALEVSEVDLNLGDLTGKESSQRQYDHLTAYFEDWTRTPHAIEYRQAKPARAQKDVLIQQLGVQIQQKDGVIQQKDVQIQAVTQEKEKANRAQRKANRAYKRGKEEKNKLEEKHAQELAAFKAKQAQELAAKDAEVQELLEDCDKAEREAAAEREAKEAKDGEIVSLKKQKTNAENKAKGNAVTAQAATGVLNDVIGAVGNMHNQLKAIGGATTATTENCISLSAEEAGALTVTGVQATIRENVMLHLLALAGPAQNDLPIRMLQARPPPAAEREPEASAGGSSDASAAGSSTAHAAM